MGDAAAPLLAVDVGNSNVVVGLFDGATLTAEFRLATDAARTADEYAAHMECLLGLHAAGIGLSGVGAAVIAGVAPVVTRRMIEVATRYAGREPLVIRAGRTETGLTIAYDPPDALGADRLVNAYAAHHLYGRQGRAGERSAACIVVDYGTATKLEAVTADGVYRGGVILPGAGIAMDALFDRAALLRRIELTEPPSAIGANTADALRAGILFGYGAQTDGLVYRFLREMGVPAEDVRVIATGGLAPLLAPYAATVEIVDTRLTLTGLRLLWERSRRTAAETGAAG